MKAVRAAYVPYLDEANLCACQLCQAVDDQRYITGLGAVVIKDDRAYWSAISAQLKALTDGTHSRVEWSEYIKTLPPADIAPQVSISSGLWLGFGSGLHDRPHPPWVPSRVYTDHPDSPAPVTEPVQLNLFEDAA